MRLFALIAFVFFGISDQTYGQTDPPYGMSELEAYSVFSGAYRTGDYQQARIFGEWLLDARPKEIQGHSGFSLDRQFERMINVYTRLADNTDDPGEKSEFLQKGAEVFNITRETFSEDEIDMFRWIFREARFYQEHYQDINGGLQKAFEAYEKAFKMDKQQFVETGDGYYARILLENYVSRGDREKALSMIEEIEPLADPSLMNVIEESRDRLFQDPEERVAFLETRVEEAENKEEVLQEILFLYEEMGEREKAKEAARSLYNENPNYTNTRKLGDIAASNAEYSEALRFYREALDKSPNQNSRKRIALTISETYQNLDQLESAREYARRAISMDNNFGQAYLQMASVYAAAISLCTSGRTMEREDKAVYWLVMDYLDMAREVDPSVRSTANQRLQSYQSVIPTSEDKFFRGWEVGESFMIDQRIGDCYAWINEETTVR